MAYLRSPLPFPLIDLKGRASILLPAFGQLIQPTLLPRWWQDALVAIPRILIGYLLTVDFGSTKFGLPWSPAEYNLGFFEVAFWFPNDVAEFGGLFAQFSNVLAWMAAFSEAVGGVFLLLGLCTRPSAMLLIPTMLVAIFFQQFDSGTWNMLPAAGILWLALYHAILGSGRFGLDYLISKNILK